MAFIRLEATAQGTSQGEMYHNKFIYVWVCVYLCTCKTTQASRLTGNVF